MAQRGNWGALACAESGSGTHGGWSSPCALSSAARVGVIGCATCRRTPTIRRWQADPEHPLRSPARCAHAHAVFSSHWWQPWAHIYFAEIRGVGFSASSLSLRRFTSLMPWRRHTGDYNTGVGWFWTQPLCRFWWEWDVWRQECKFYRSRAKRKLSKGKKRKQLCLFVVRGVAGKTDYCVLGQWVFPMSSCHGPP